MEYESIFIKGGNFYFVKRDNYESMERFNERGWYIANRRPKTIEEYNESVRLSRVWANINLSGLSYKQVELSQIKLN